MLLAVNCDFKGNDYGKHKQTHNQKCLATCRTEDKCTHFSWSNSRCFKKTGPVNQTDAFYRSGYLCAISLSGQNTNTNSEKSMD